MKCGENSGNLKSKLGKKKLQIVSSKNPIIPQDQILWRIIADINLGYKRNVLITTEITHFRSSHCYKVFQK